MITRQKINSLLVTFSVGAFVGSLVFGQQVNQSGQPAYQQPVQPSPVYQQPVYPSQGVPSYPQQGFPQPTYPQQYPNQIYGGQIINGQPVQGGIIYDQQGRALPPTPPQPSQGQPQQPKPQQPTRPANRQQRLTDEQIENARKNFALQAQQLKMLTVENEKLRALKVENDKLRTDYQSLLSENAKVKSNLIQLRNEPAMSPADSSQGNAKLAEMNGLYQDAVSKNQVLSNQMQTAVSKNEALNNQMRSLSNEVQTLMNENSSIKTKLANLSSTSNEMAEVQSDPTSENQLAVLNQQKAELNQQNQSLVAENGRLQGLNQDISAENETLTQRIDELSAETQRLLGLNQSASSDFDSLNQRVSSLTSQNEQYEAEIRSNLAANKEVKTNAQFVSAPNSNVVAELTAKNRVLSDSHKKAMAQNSQLTQQLSKLKSDASKLKLRSSESASTGSLLGANLNASDGVNDAASDGRFNVAKWLLPFLLIGLGIGLYVFLTEESQGTIRTIAATGEDRNNEPTSNG